MPSIARRALSVLALSLLCVLGLPQQTKARAGSLVVTWDLSMQKSAAGVPTLVVRIDVHNRTNASHAIPVFLPTLSATFRHGDDEHRSSASSSHLLPPLPPTHPPPSQGTQLPSLVGGPFTVQHPGALIVGPHRRATFGVFRFELQAPYSRGAQVQLRLFHRTPETRPGIWSSLPPPGMFDGEHFAGRL